MLGTVISSQAKVKQMHKWIVKINGQMVKKKKKILMNEIEVLKINLLSYYQW